ncbi:tick transposon [Plakobranchus ocellatus]|uniref:Tick transposon n=1 Tax=Plakobranchus ocellatus TaxID=259542 RepID=A0AAV3YQF1_9GAST|nr:tick transposon [Plakobranchus ocellatus]
MGNKLNSATYFIKLDHTKGYWQIPIKEDHTKYTAFRSHTGLIEFNFMPFGLSTARSTFQLAMSHTLRDLLFLVSYFDDVLIFSETLSSHVKHIQATLTELKNANLTFRPSKAHTGFDSIDFLGHTTLQDKVLPDREKTVTIRQINTPTSKKEIKRILGLLNYYRRFAQDFSKLAQPLTDLTKARAPN